jgi:hypothetical protein
MAKGISKQDQKAALIEALNDSLGVIYAACEAAKVSRSTYYNWLAVDADFREKVNEVLLTQSEFVEGKLLEGIQAGDMNATKFYLQTKGRHLGYGVRRTDDTQRGGGQYDGRSETETAQRELERLNARFAEERKAITRLLKDQRKYTPELDLQIDVCAKLKVQEEELNNRLMLSGYSPTITEYSREGEPRSVINPVWKVYQDTAEQLQKALRALGMNTESKERKTDGETAVGFLEELQARQQRRREDKE